MTEEVFWLRSTPQEFYRWLKWQQMSSSLREVKVKGGRWSLLSCEARRVDNPPGLFHVYYPTAFRGNDEVLYTSVSGPGVNLLIVALDEERIEVTARCDMEPLQPFFWVLLSRIAGTFEESAERLRRYISSEGIAERPVDAIPRSILDDPGFRRLTKWVVSGETGEETKQANEERGPKAGTLARVLEAHRLLKTGKHSQRWVMKRCKLDVRTYQQRCKEATGEEPIVPGQLLE